MGEMGNSLVHIYKKKTGKLNLSYFQKHIDLIDNRNSSVASSVSNKSDVASDLLSSYLSSFI